MSESDYEGTPEEQDTAESAQLRPMRWAYETDDTTDEQ